MAISYITYVDEPDIDKAFQQVIPPLARHASYVLHQETPEHQVDAVQIASESVDKAPYNHALSPVGAIPVILPDMRELTVIVFPFQDEPDAETYAIDLDSPRGLQQFGKVLEMELQSVRGKPKRGEEMIGYEIVSTDTMLLDGEERKFNIVARVSIRETSEHITGYVFFGQGVDATSDDE